MTKTVTKADITERLHNELGLNKSECKIIVEDFFRTIKEALLNNEQVVSYTHLTLPTICSV